MSKAIRYRLFNGTEIEISEDPNLVPGEQHYLCPPDVKIPTWKVPPEEDPFPTTEEIHKMLMDPNALILRVGRSKWNGAGALIEGTKMEEMKSTLNLTTPPQTAEQFREEYRKFGNLPTECLSTSVKGWMERLRWAIERIEILEQQVEALKNQAAFPGSEPQIMEMEAKIHSRDQKIQECFRAALKLEGERDALKDIVMAQLGLQRDRD